MSVLYNISVNQTINRPTNQPTNQPTYQPTIQPTNQPINQLINQPNNQSKPWICMVVKKGGLLEKLVGDIGREVGGRDGLSVVGACTQERTIARLQRLAYTFLC
jgi:hypothetical protein